MRAVLLGPPGAGKGTHADAAASAAGVPHVSTGDLFRAHVGDGTPLGLRVQGYLDRGDLVPDDLTVELLHERLAEPDAERGFLLDGFPRTVPQAEALAASLAADGHGLDVVVQLDVDEAEVVRRLSGRRSCTACGRTSHVDLDPSAADGRCPRCGGAVVRRDDDAPATVAHRMHVFAQQTEPLVDHYRDLGLLVAVDAAGDVEAVRERIVGALRTGPRSSATTG